jgi:hypothetical protein
MPLLVLASPLAMIRPTTPVEKLKRLTSLLTLAQGYVEKNIKKIMELITEAWEMSKSMVSFGTREHTFHEYLQADLKNKEGFHLDTFVPFGFKVTNMTELRRIEEDIPSMNQLKQLNACWKEKAKNLNIILQAYS